METLKESIKEFIAHCQFEKNLSEKTIRAYKIDTQQLVDFTKEIKYCDKVKSIDKTILRDYLQSISTFKPKTVKRKIATIKAMFNFFEFEDRILINPFRKMRIQIREPKMLPNVMNLLEIEKIINSAYSHKYAEKRIESYSYKKKVRDVAVIELLFATGMRVSELSGLRRENIDLAGGLIKIMGKGRKERIIQVCNIETLKSLKDCELLFRKETVKCGGYFFVNRFGNKLSEQSVRYLVKDHAEKAGLHKRITPHVFRHSFATLLLEENVDIKYIQHLLGHSSIMTTQIYTHVNGEKQRQILSKSHPRGNFNVKTHY